MDELFDELIRGKEEREERGNEEGVNRARG